MKKSCIRFFTMLAVVSIVFTGCKDDSNPFTGLRLSATKMIVDPDASTDITATYIVEDAADNSVQITFSISGDTSGGAYFGTAGTKTETVASGGKTTLTMGGKNSGYVTVTATCGETSAKMTLGTTVVISPDDVPIGYAGEGWTPFYDAEKVVTVSTKADLKTYAEKGGYTVYVDGMIDMSDGMLPSVNYDAAPSALDDFVNTNTGGTYTTYAAWKAAYGSVSTSTNDTGSGTSKSALYDTMRTLNSNYKKIIQLNIAAKTAIIGKGTGSGIKGAAIGVSKSHIVIRNLTIQDACDPFAHHETTSKGASDGFNAQFDNIGISGGNHVWIDHCTLEDTMRLVSASNGEKWQTYDGLCDITNTSSYVTVSNCILRNHDKTMLIGNGSSDINGGHITLTENYFFGCGQRLPLATYAEMHIFNNYYDGSGGFYSNSYCISGRYATYTIIAENNNFRSVASPFASSSSGSSGMCYVSGNSGGSGDLSTSSIKPFTVPYEYMLLSAEEVPAAVEKYTGAGKVSVK